MNNNININLNPRSNNWESIELTDAIISRYSLKKWADNFSLMTAGYRDQLSPEDINNPDVAFNSLTVSIFGEAKARVFSKKLSKGATGSVHVGGETRPHTQEFISILARIYAANGIKVHLRKRVQTTPIWYSSYGTFFEEYDSGDNFTASHSQYFKGGWKPMDFEGKQLLEEEGAIIAEVKSIVENCDTINFAPLNSPLILNDFDVDEGYVTYLKTIIDHNMFAEIKKASVSGFRCAAYTLGGSMKATTEHLFSLLDISTGSDGIIQYYLGEEDLMYHKVGQINGKNYGVDPSKPEVFQNIGAQELLMNSKANIVFIWDPDGDRFNIVSIAPLSVKDKALEYGLMVETFPNDSNQCIVYFTPNQIYFMLAAYRISSLKESKEIDKYNWFVGRSVSSTRSIDELVFSEKIPVVDVRVGFKHLGSLSGWIEKHLDLPEVYTSVTGKETVFGKKPRTLIMYEESGGAAFGGTELLKSKSGDKTLLTMREKDGMQVALFTLSLAAYLYNSDKSFAEYYIQTIKKNNIKYKYFSRKDLTLYDESLMGVEREKAKEAGILKRDKVMDYFKDLAEKHSKGTSLSEIQLILNTKLRENKYPLSEPVNICFVGDGTLLEFNSYWFLIRASGTDAVLRYYMEGEDNLVIQSILKALINIDI